MPFLLLVIRNGPMAGHGGEQANHYGSLYGLSGIRRLGLNLKLVAAILVWACCLDPRFAAQYALFVELRHAEREGEPVNLPNRRAGSVSAVS